MFLSFAKVAGLKLYNFHRSFPEYNAIVYIVAVEARTGWEISRWQEYMRGWKLLRKAYRILLPLPLSLSFYENVQAARVSWNGYCGSSSINALNASQIKDIKSNEPQYRQLISVFSGINVTYRNRVLLFTLQMQIFYKTNLENELPGVRMWWPWMRLWFCCNHNLIKNPFDNVSNYFLDFSNVFALSNGKLFSITLHLFTRTRSFLYADDTFYPFYMR